MPREMTKVVFDDIPQVEGSVAAQHEREHWGRLTEHLEREAGNEVARVRRERETVTAPHRRGTEQRNQQRVLPALIARWELLGLERYGLSGTDR